MTNGELSRWVINELKPLYGEREARAMQRMLYSYIGGNDISEWLLLFDQPVNSEFHEKLTHAVIELKLFKPIQYIIGHMHFCDLEFKVNSNVLIPRPETEELVRMISVDLMKDTRYNILDIGTGSGIIAISLAKMLPLAKVTAIDISEGALETASINALDNEVIVDFIRFDILGYLHYHNSDVNLTLGSAQNESYPYQDAQYDVIVSNPPYVKNSEKSEMSINVLDYEPKIALFVSDEDPLIYYKAIINFAKLHLNDKGSIYFEINENEGENLKSILSLEGFDKIEIIKDMNDKHRFIKSIKKTL